MKKISMLLAAIILCAVLLPMNVFASSSNDTLLAPALDEDIYVYDSDSIDWDEIDEIIVLKASLDDPFINDAISRGVKITYEPGAFISARFTYFSSISWLPRDGVMSLSLMPKSPWSISHNSWYEAAQFFQYHPIYTNINNPSKFNSMYNQYICHVNLAQGFKLPWNLEPIKPDKGYAQWQGSGCN